MSQVASYRILAKYYDSFAGKKRYKEWEVFLNSLVKKYKIEKKIAVDLACGTGINSKTLRNIGFEKVLGVKKEIAENDACLIEHSLSEETFLFFAEFLNKEGHLDEFPKKSKLKEIICEDYRERYDGLSLCKK